ncbi:MAG: hypothetical protein KJO29_04710 [Bacteroidia bacterium]|nr:hypothetical protein [Bacteroidia bacterium]
MRNLYTLSSNSSVLSVEKFLFGNFNPVKHFSRLVLIPIFIIFTFGIKTFAFDTWDHGDTPDEFSILNIDVSEEDNYALLSAEVDRENIINNKIFKALLMVMATADPTACYGVDDDNNILVKMNRSTGSVSTIGNLGVSNVEAIAFTEDATTLYAANAGDFGTLDLNSGTFTSIGSFGTGTGDQGSVDFNDADGLMLDATTGIVYATERYGDGGAPADVLFQVNTSTGSHVNGAFGGDDYVTIQPVTFGGTTYYDIDDIAVDPVSGQMYGIANNGGGINLLVTIDKTNGNTSIVGTFNIGGSNINDVEGLSFYNDGTLYASSGDSPADMYLVD